MYLLFRSSTVALRGFSRRFASRASYVIALKLALYPK